jgi:hypothetical protein
MNPPLQLLGKFLSKRCTKAELVERNILFDSSYESEQNSTFRTSVSVPNSAELRLFHAFESELIKGAKIYISSSICTLNTLYKHTLILSILSFYHILIAFSRFTIQSFRKFDSEIRRIGIWREDWRRGLQFCE